ncbi:hypothetical protein K440DRAFT_624061 [Wilcoxina mikolae CBS 423.85]|nr:hypothetical protein K440DRAFT_633880 [Wilcoxina mikolae CBS 423.85]KAF8241573.1 hypothetical protein K440DRAFT_624061 [Wilcoxina mikolae CBS 423.85]
MARTHKVLQHDLSAATPLNKVVARKNAALEHEDKEVKARMKILEESQCVWWASSRA